MIVYQPAHQITNGVDFVDIRNNPEENISELHVSLKGHICEDNTSTSNLQSNGIFIGDWQDTIDFGSVIIGIIADQNSATNGLEIQYSQNGMDVHDFDKFTITANIGKVFTVSPSHQYIRIKYTNGINEQTSFILSTILKRVYIKPSSHRINDSIVGEDDAQLVKSVTTGLAPDGEFKNVLVTNSGNQKISIEEFENDVSVNSNTQLKTTIFNSDGNEISTQQSSDGGYHLGSSIIQDIYSSSGNSTTTNLSAGETFTGTSEETFGINGIQIYHFADQDCTVYLDQGLNNSDWDVIDSFNCLANKACTRTFTSVAPYFRIRIKNIDVTSTTSIRTAAGMTPIINPLPRALTDDDRLKVETTLTGRENTSRHLWVSPTNSISVDQEVRLVGTNFDGTTKDPNFWTETVTGTGSVTQTGEIKLNTGLTPDSTSRYDSVRSARFVVGSALLFTGIYKFNDALVENNIRRCGAYDTDEGFFFEVNGTTFSLGSRKTTNDTLINSGNFNGNYGPHFTINPTIYYKFAIEWTPLGCFYYINNILLHKNIGGHLTRKLTLPIRFENNNVNGASTDVTFDCLGVVIMREGKLETNSTYKYISGATTTVLKYGAGTLHTIVNNDNTGSCIVYDNTVASGNIIANIDLIKVLGTQTFNTPFSTGLTIVTSGTAKITVVYE